LWRTERGGALGEDGAGPDAGCRPEEGDAGVGLGFRDKVEREVGGSLSG
jgi:hypothetical protein